MNRISLFLPPAARLRPALFLLLILVTGGALFAQEGTVRFIDDAPPPATVPCFGDITRGEGLRATIERAGGVLDTVLVQPTDEAVSDQLICTGGTLLRRWLITGAINADLESQLFTFGPPPAGDGPVVDSTALPPLDVTVDCRLVSTPAAPESYVRWLTDRRVAVANAAGPGCSPVTDVDDNAPDVPPTLGCGDSLAVDFTITDLCGGATDLRFVYRTVDTTGPVIVGVTSADIPISCTDTVPAVPVVTLEDCDPQATFTFTEVSTFNPDAVGCAAYNYDVVRTWVASDRCGNSTVVRRTYNIRDNVAPDFDRPEPLALRCNQDPFDLDVTGRPSNLSDNCAPAADLTVSFTDEVVQFEVCADRFDVLRTWRVTDPCGNSRVRVQQIIVRDEVDPSFTPPAAILDVDCTEYLDLDVTGRPTNLIDNCGGPVNLSFDDDITPGDCPGNFTVRRRWRIFDACGNDRFFEQRLNVSDNTPPVVLTAPEPLTETCSAGFRNQQLIFNRWIGELAGASFTDACTADEELTITLAETGTTEFPSLPPFGCADANGVVRFVSVDITATDACGNATTVTTEYRQLDPVGIVLFDCPPNQVIPTTPDECSAVVDLPIPAFIERCAQGNPFQLEVYDTVAITSAATNPAELGTVPVDPILIEFPVPLDQPVSGFEAGVLTITLENVDAEGPDEFFFIYNELDELVGTTERGNVQCETVVTIDSITGTEFTRFARDGVVTFRLEPNVPAGEPGTFAINNLCGNSRVLAYLRQGIIDLAPITYEVEVDGGGYTVIDPIRDLDTVLDVGLHQISYRGTDCGGSVDVCTFTVTVEDRQPPVVTCPADISLILAADSCQTTYTLPLPVNVEDNCEPYDLVTETFPATGTDPALFPFAFDPNLNSFQAQQLTAVLSAAPANLTDSVDFDVAFRGRFGQPRAFLDVVLPDGTVAASTTSGAADCSTTGLLSFRLAATDFQALRGGNGDFLLQLRPRPVTVPPGQPGDGLTPCDAGAVTNSGDTDGVSGLRVTVTYRTLYPDYFTTGATVVGRSSTSASAPNPVVTFNQGVTAFSYVVTDLGGNADTCTINVTVTDVTPPVARCQPTTVTVDPSGLAPTVLDPLLIGGNSTDNCGITDYAVTPDVFSCDEYGTTTTVSLTVTDGSGNQDSCTTIISIAPAVPEPTASTSVCGGDTLRLRANPPTVAAPGQTIYTFQWFGPAGNLISTQENPVIPGVDESDEGAYRVVIRGLTGCEAEGVVVIDIGGTPATPVIQAPNQVCTGEDVPLTVLTSYTGAVRYEWYRGRPGAGVFVGQSSTAVFPAPFAGPTGAAEFYAIAFINGCESAPSNVVAVSRTTRPDVAIDLPNRGTCELGGITFTAVGPASLVYVWTGPNNFRDTGQTIRLEDVTLDAEGTYAVRSVRGGGCFSEPATVDLTVFPAGAPTELLPVAPVCIGDTLELSATDESGDLYLFAGPNDLAFESTSRHLRLSPVTAAFAGDWTVRIQRGNCPSAPSQPVNVRLGASPTPFLSVVPDPVCEGNDLILQGGSSVAGSTYSWTGPNGFRATGIAPVLQNANSNDNGTYVATITGPVGCSATDSLEVTVLPGLRIDSIVVSAATCLIGGEPVSLSAFVNGAPATDADYFFQWVGPEGGSQSDTFRIPNVGLSSNGQYGLTVSDQRGCTSPRFLMGVEFDFAPATPVAPFVADGSTNFCAGVDLDLMTNDFGPGTTYLWSLADGTIIPTQTNNLPLRGVDATATGSYSVRVLRGGCTSLPSAPRTFTVTDFPAVTVTANDPACSGQPIRFFATDIAGAEYVWTGPNNFSSSLPNPVIVSADSTVHAGEYSVVANVNGCRSRVETVTVEVRQTPAVPVVQPIPSVCISDPDAVLELSVNPNTATAGATYQWFINDNQVPVGEPTGDLTLTVTDLGLFAGGGVFDFTVSAISEGCGSAPSTPVSVRLDEIPDYQPDAGRDTTICAGLFVLDAAPGGVGQGRWSLVEGTGDVDIINPGQRTTAVQGLTEFGGPYRFAWTLSNGSCGDYASDTITLTVTDGEEAIAGENLIACVRDEVRLNAVPAMMSGSGGRWTQALAQELLGVTIVSPTDANTVLTGLQPDNIYSFTWTVTSNCGVKTDVVVVNVSDPTPFAGDDQTVCNDERAAELQADEPTLGSRGRWLTPQPDMTIVEPDSPRTRVIGLTPGPNLFVWQVDDAICGDRSRDTVVIDYAAPPAPRDDDYAVAFQGEVTFDPTENDDNPADAVVTFLTVPAGARLTDNGDGTFTFFPPANFVGELALDYEVGSPGCAVGGATAFFTVGEGVDCTPPNIFTPNGDGMNDRFVVPCLLDTDRFPNSQVTIYNQWGDEVFRSGTPYRSDWDGTYQGSRLPVATYFYTIDFGNGREGATGSVRIER